MNICLVSTVGYPTRDPQAGGVPICTRNLAYALSEEGHRVIVITQKGKGIVTRENDGPVILYSAFVTDLHYHISKLGKSVGMWPSIIKIFEVGWAVRKAVLKLTKEVNIDIVQYPNAWAEGIFHPKQIKMSVRMDTPLCLVRNLPDVGEHIGWGLYERFERSAIRKADLISCHTPIVAEQVIHLYSIDRAKIVVIPNLVDTGTYKPVERSQRNNFRLFHPGPRLGDRQKGTAILLEAMKHVLNKFPKTELHIAGKGRIDFLKHGEKVAGCIKDLGWLDSKSLAKEYVEADLCIVPSINWETFSNVCGESLSCGTPVIASAVGGMPDVVKHGQTGLIFPASDVQALAQAIINLLSNPGLRLQMGRKASIEAERLLSYRSVAKKTVQAFKAIIQA